MNMEVVYLEMFVTWICGLWKCNKKVEMVYGNLMVYVWYLETLNKFGSLYGICL